MPINAALNARATLHVQSALFIHLSPFPMLVISLIGLHSSNMIEMPSSRCRRPGGRTIVGPLEGEPFDVLTIGIDHIDLALSVGRRTEYQMPAIRRPGR